MNELILSGPTAKRCTKCGVKKSVAEFSRCTRNKNGLRSECKSCGAAYTAARKEERVVYHAAYRSSHREEKTAYNATYYAAHREEMIASQAVWQRENPDKVRARTHRRRARRLNAPGTHTAQQIKDLLQKQSFRCAYCRKSIKSGYHVDHIIPLSRGGGNGVTNIQILCPHCNCSKNAKDPIHFAQQLGKLL